MLAVKSHLKPKRNFAKSVFLTIYPKIFRDKYKYGEKSRNNSKTEMLKSADEKDVSNKM